MSLRTNISLISNTIELDPASAYAQAIWYSIQAVIGIPANFLLIVLWSTTAELRKIPANIFIINAAVADALCLFSVSFFNLHWLLTRNLNICKIGGVLVYFSAMFGLFIAPYLAINRFIVIRRINKLTHSWKEKLVSVKGAVLLCATLWLYILCTNVPFIFLDMYGRDVMGICGLILDLPIGLFILMYAGMIGPFFMSLILTYVYYRKLAAWVNKMTKEYLSDKKESSMKETQSLMKMMKYLALLPVVCFGPFGCYDFVVRLFPELISIRIARITMISYVFPSLCNPFLTVYFMKPFRNALQGKWRMVKANLFLNGHVAPLPARRVADNTSNRALPARHESSALKINGISIVQNLM